MNKTHLLLTLICTASLSWSAPIKLYVSPTGSDDALGTKAAPFKTLEQARDTLRTKVRGEGAEVILAPGIYERTQVFELGIDDSGTAKAPIVYHAEKPGTVRLIGGKKVPASAAKPLKDPAVLARIIDSTARPHLMQIDLKKASITDFGKMKSRGFRRPYVTAPLEIFINGEALHIARWPNKGNVQIGKVIDKGSVPREDDFSNRGGSFTFDYDRPAKWSQANNIWLSGLFAHGYADDTIPVENIDLKKKVIKLGKPHMYGIMTGRAFRSYFALNLLEEIDQPGEYYVDRETGMLYFYPPCPMKDADICISVLEEPMVALENVSHVHFENLTLEATRGMGVYIEGGTANQISGCTLCNMGIVAVCIGKGITPDPMYRHQYSGKPISRELGSWHEHIYENPAFDRNGGTKHGIVSCDIYNIGAGGISLGGGNRLTLDPAGNYVRNCDIHHFNRLDRAYKAGVNIDGVGNRIEHCKIHNCPNSAIYLHGNDHLIEYNEVYNACLHVDDHGFFYLGRDPSERGNLLRYNFWHHSAIGPDAHGGAFGIYNDDGACGTKVFGNVFYKAGKSGVMNYGGGSDMQFDNCIVIDCPVPYRADSRLKNWGPGIEVARKDGLFGQRLDLVNFTEPPYSTRYPELTGYWTEDHRTPKANTFNNNLIVDKRRLDMKKMRGSQWVNIGDVWITSTNPGFIDAPSMNFALQKDSPVYQKLPNFKPIPFGNIGLYTDSFRP